MRPLLFLCHVDAKWIKQRPQFLAEAMNQEAPPVVFAYAWGWTRSILVRGEGRLSCRTLPLFVSPYRWRRLLWPIESIAQFVYAVFLRIFFRPRVCLLTGPRLTVTGIALKRVFGVPFIYDLMDRNGHFPGSRELEIRLESWALREADLVLCSSETLREDVRRNIPAKKVVVVRNALSKERQWRLEPDQPGLRPTVDEVGSCRLRYFGAVSSWFDIEVLKGALQLRPNWTVECWGPADVELNHADSRIVFHPPVPHRELPHLMASAHVLIMPFTVTRLIEAVDPVKAYEYLATGKPVVLTRYRETEHFSEAGACLFDAGDPYSFVQAVERARVGIARDMDRFIDQNSWEARATLAIRAISEVL